MSQYDVCLGTKSNVVLTTKDQETADALVAFLEKHRTQLFQAEDLKPFAHPVERGPVEAPAASATPEPAAEAPTEPAAPEPDAKPARGSKPKE